MREEIDKDRSDRAIARIAERQHGVITTRQLAAVGVEKSAVSRRVQAGRLHRLYRGVYAVGHRRISREGRWLAAVFACGTSAVLSHRSAAALWGIRPQSSGPIEVTVPATGGRAKRPGLLIHRSTCLDPSDTTRSNGIPVTTPKRTISDLRRALPADQIDAAIRRAEGPSPRHRTAARLRARPGTQRARAHGASDLPAPPPPDPGGQRPRRSLLGRLPVAGPRADRRDRYGYHGTRSAFEADRERDVQLQLMGFTVLRFTHRQVSDADAFAATLAAVLGLE